jgi:ABC-type protease/lipase transport system fused ATPase/permease subunit
VAALSAAINVLYLTGSFFMLQVYDRVLPSGSIPTLTALAMLAAALYAFQGALDIIRGRLLVRVGGSVDAALSQRVYQAVVRQPLRAPGHGDGLGPVRDLDQIRTFLSGMGPLAFCDLPWLPIYVGICFIFHPVIGLAALVGAIILLALALCTEFLSRGPAAVSAGLAIRRNTKGGPRLGTHKSTAVTCLPNAARATSPAASGRCRKLLGCSFSRPFSQSAPCW